MRLLFTSTSGLGHFLPLVPLIRAARAANHDVAVASPARLADRVAELGVMHRVVAAPTEADYELQRSRFADAADSGAQVARQMFGRLKPRASLPGMVAFIQEWRPDVVISESAEFSAAMVAEARGIPSARVHPGLAGLHLFEGMVGPLLAPLRGELGLPEDPDAGWLLKARQISYFPAEFDLPTPADVSRIRATPGRPVALPRKDTIYVTFGTEIVGMPMFAQVARASVDAVQAVGLDAVLTIGHANPAPFVGLRDLRVEQWVDQTELLPQVRAVICHAGSGTTLGALAAGTPIIAVPFFADQPFNADRIAATDTGVSVPPGPGLTERLTGALRQVLAQEPLGCRPMAEAIRALPDPREAVDMVGALLHRTAVLT